MSNKEFAMVLSGGGAKGAYQVGAFKAIQEAGLEITAVSGSSVGGINALAWSLWSFEKTEALWESFGFSDFFSLDETVLPDGLSNRDALERILEREIEEYLPYFKVPTYVTIATDDPQPHYMKLNGRTKDEIITLLLATSAIPIVFPQVQIESTLYQDGGVADNLPVVPLYLDGHRNIISIGLSDKLRYDEDRFPIENLIEIVPTTDLGGFLDGTINFSDSAKSFAYKLGYADAKRAIEEYLYGTPNTAEMAEADRKQIDAEMTYERLSKKIDSTFDKLNKYIDS